MFHHAASPVPTVAAGPPVGLFAMALGAGVLLHSALGLGRSGRAYLLPVLFGLIALAGFLLNPFADASTPQDLRAGLTSPEALTLLCIAQFLLCAAGVTLAVRADDLRRERSGLWLAVLHTPPAPMLLVAMLVLEQSLLVSTPGARPESIGWGVGLGAALVATALAGLALWLPDRLLAAAYRLLGFGLLLACMLLPNLQRPLPAPLGELDVASLVLGAEVALGAATIVAVGWAWQRFGPGARGRASLSLEGELPQWDS